MSVTGGVRGRVVKVAAGRVTVQIEGRPMASATYGRAIRIGDPVRIDVESCGRRGSIDPASRAWTYADRDDVECDLSRDHVSRGGAHSARLIVNGRWTRVWWKR